MELGVFEILAGLCILIFAIHYYLTYTFDFWEKQNVKGPKPLPLFGNFKDALFGKVHLAMLIKRFYDDYRGEPLVGVYGKSAPQVILRDPELIKDVLIKNFNVFPARGLAIPKKDDPFNQNLFALEHERWRPLRSKLSPVFSSGKLKDMFYLLLDCAEHFEKYVERLAVKGEPIECLELTAKYTTDTIAVCAFGLNTDALTDEDSNFRRAGRDLMGNSFINILVRMCMEWFPRFYGVLKPWRFSKAIGFFIATLKDTVEYRKKNNVRRNDFVDSLMDLRDKPEKLSNFEFTDELLTSQAFIFFLAGFETTSTTMSNAFYELAFDQHAQNKLREEIKKTVEEDGKLTYENIKRMKYFDKVVKETIRKYPPGSIIHRMSAAPYTFSGINVSIPINTMVIIPIWAIHNDPDIFPNPDLFDPERFNEENEKSRHPMNYLPFGDGPHNCIASRFANYQTKIGIAALISNFRVDVCDKTCIPYRIDPRSFIPAPIGEIYLKITKL